MTPAVEAEAEGQPAEEPQRVWRQASAAVETAAAAVQTASAEAFEAAEPFHHSGMVAAVAAAAAAAAAQMTDASASAAEARALQHRCR